MIIYINGSRATLSTNLMPASSLQAAVNSTYQHQIGCCLYDSKAPPIYSNNWLFQRADEQGLFR